jgi:cellulose synthase/poly-beta-1,6-N-acetylglucosamine synthase-like glycosyltransferase
MTTAEIFILFIYYFAMLGISVFGFHALALCLIYLLHSKKNAPVPPEITEWPSVCVQLPVYNERFVVERLIDSVCRLDYPPVALSIQVLDDSIDETTELARRLVDRYAHRGVNIRLIHRQDRTGYKAGALAAGMEQISEEYIAIFDADFVPPVDFLRRLVPFLAADPDLGMVQARWGHLNDSYNAVTRAQAISLDGQLIVVQNARLAADLVIKFAGSAGVWRKACIQDAGGWQGDTLTEDLDISFRARLMGWKMLYLPDVLVPAEIPPYLSAYKAQLYRWAFGSTQVLRKLWRRIIWGPLSLFQRLDALIHLTAYSAQCLFLVILLVCVPYALATGLRLPILPWVWVAGVGAPLLLAISQRAIYPDWKRRFFYFPVLILLGFGFGLKVSLAVVTALLQRDEGFNRTPKYDLMGRQDLWKEKDYSMTADWTLLGEALMAVYCGIASVIALNEIPRIAPLLGLISISYGYVAWMGFWQTAIAKRGLRRAKVALNR